MVWDEASAQSPRAAYLTMTETVDAIYGELKALILIKRMT